MTAAIDRRKFIAISAASSGPERAAFWRSQQAAARHLVEWRGTCLGAVSPRFASTTRRVRGEGSCPPGVAEARRLEALFSLYREESVLCQLNRHGVLASPPSELSELLVACNHYWEITGGVFDPTVQALWRCYAESFSTKGTSANGSRERRPHWSWLAGVMCVSIAIGWCSRVPAWVLH